MPDPQRIGKYDIQGILGKGAMGVVYKAFDPTIERPVAIKTVRKDLVDPDLVEQSMARFKNEAKAAGRLLHPNIVSVYEYGEDEANAFIVMEYVEGTGLREYLNRKAAFDLGQITAIMTQLLLALDFAHERGVVHRDIKPSNLILTTNGSLKVADFGIARIDTSNLTTLGMVMGTPSYMSPEQCQGQAVDRRSDLFSAGVVFYELLTGEKPFGGPMETIGHKICHEDPRPPSSVSRLQLSPTVDAVVATALEKKPDGRFQNARAFGRALRTACDALIADDAAGATELNVAAIKLESTVVLPIFDDTVLRTVERRLAHYVGPMARVMIRKAASQTSDLGELYSLLSDNIQDPEQRRKFFEEAEASGVNTGSSPRVHMTGGQAAAKPAPLERSFVDETTQRLAVYLGPIAKVVASRAAQKAASREEFVELVAGHLGTQDRGAFLREIGFGER
ncbi:MAG TPA: serine/threonine-protein kinase [Casimicrobiaceae bacterium]|nr:serine/threonine-protein kinase [Casimicrobiaceae bacterium]